MASAIRAGIGVWITVHDTDGNEIHVVSTSRDGELFDVVVDIDDIRNTAFEEGAALAQPRL